MYSLHIPPGGLHSKPEAAHFMLRSFRQEVPVPLLPASPVAPGSGAQEWLSVPSRQDFCVFFLLQLKQ